jgi:ATP-binding cassette, subfamily B, bacterial
MAKLKSAQILDPASWGATVQFCARYWGRQWRGMLVVVGLLLAMTAAEVSIPIAAGHLVDGLAALDPTLAYDSALAALGFLSLVLFAQFGLRDLAFRAWNRIEASNMVAVLDDGFARVQTFSSDWHANTFAGATVRKLTRGKWAYEHISDIIWMRFLPLSLTIAGLALVMFSRFPLVGSLFVAVIVTYLIASVVLAAYYVRPAKVRAAAIDSQLGGAIADAISNNAAVKAFGAETRELALFQKVTERWRHLALRGWRRGLDMSLVQHSLWVSLQAGMLFVLIQMSVSGRASPGDVTFVIAACFQLGGQLRQIGEHLRILQQAMSELGDLVEFADQPLGVVSRANAPPLNAKAGEIVFDAVHFSYPGQTPLYAGFDLRIAPGEHVGLVGPSGSGKSTFVKLIQRLYDVDDGVIWIDGHDIAEVEQASLRRCVSTVPQEPVLFHRSLADNISYACPNATEAEIVAAAKRARAHEFISRLPMGYATLVGERGVKLSGGERQRVAIARAFLANAPIVIFDEATSSLDTVTERLVQAAMAELMVGRTTIVIAHRLSTVRHVDRILVFSNGSVVEQGNHEELLALNDGHYSALHRAALEVS